LKGAENRYDGWTAIAVMLTGGYLLMVIWPLALVLLGSVTNADGFSLQGFRTFFSSRL
jgi:iron(III) transport system permease protein